MILAGDVGATKSLMGLFRRRPGGAESLREETLPTIDHASPISLIEAFAGKDMRRVRRVVLGVAGPVSRGKAMQVNLPWKVDSAKLEARLERPVHLLNDLEAMGWGISALPPGRLRALTGGRRAGEGDAALIAPGTGLGTARLRRVGDGFEPLPGEGGHCGFAPRDDLDVALFRWLRRRHGRVSLERILGGSGISSLYRFLLESGWQDTVPTDLPRIDRAQDRNAAIVNAAGEGDPLACWVVEWYARLLGSAAGDLALTHNATGGVFIGGGIAPRILPFLQGGGFLEAFVDQGRMRSLVEKIPVRVILDPRTALLGAAVHAANLSATRATGRRGPSKKK